MSVCGKCGTAMKENVKYCKSCGKQASFEDKKARVMENKSGNSWAKPAIIAALAVLVAVGGWMYRESKAGAGMNGQVMFSPNRGASTKAAAPVKAEKGEVRIPSAGIQDGNAHFFAYQAGGKTVTFFIMKAADGGIRTAFDACVACNHAKLGYRQEGKTVVCNNCGMGFSPDDIGKQSGGCNPIPVQKTTDGQMIVLKAKDLEAGVLYF